MEGEDDMRHRVCLLLYHQAWHKMFSKCLLLESTQTSNDSTEVGKGDREEVKSLT